MTSEPGQTSTVILQEFLDDPKNKVLFGEFAGKYGPRIRSRCRSLGIQDMDSDDLAAAILLRFFERDTFKDFMFQGKEKFDRWLKTTVKHAVFSFKRDRGRQPDAWSVGDSDAQGSLQKVADEVADDLSSACERERQLVLEARRRVQARVEPKTWQVFCLLVDEQLPVAEVTMRTGLSDFNVWKIRSRVLRLIREEVAKLSTEGPSEQP
jgi:DNA-directed RNA polymerase specialized sigma24 family protein